MTTKEDLDDTLRNIACTLYRLSEDLRDVSRQGHHSFNGYLKMLDRFTVMAAVQTLRALNSGAFPNTPLTASAKVFLRFKSNASDVGKYSCSDSTSVLLESDRLLTWWRNGVMPITTLLAWDIGYALPPDYSLFGSGYSDLKIGGKDAVTRMQTQDHQSSNGSSIDGIELLNFMAKDYSIGCELLGKTLSKSEPSHPTLTRHAGEGVMKPNAHSPDFRSIRWEGDLFSFTASQAVVIKGLWEASMEGTPDVGDAYLLELAGSEGSRLRDVFKNNPAWATLIVDGQTKGSHRIRPCSKY